MNREGMDMYSKEAYFNWLTSEQKKEGLTLQSIKDTMRTLEYRYHFQEKLNENDGENVISLFSKTFVEITKRNTFLIKVFNDKEDVDDKLIESVFGDRKTLFLFEIRRILEKLILSYTSKKIVKNENRSAGYGNFPTWNKKSNSLKHNVEFNQNLLDLVNDDEHFYGKYRIKYSHPYYDTKLFNEMYEKFSKIKAFDLGELKVLDNNRGQFLYNLFSGYEKRVYQGILTKIEQQQLPKNFNPLLKVSKKDSLELTEAIATQVFDEYLKLPEELYFSSNDYISGLNEKKLSVYDFASHPVELTKKRIHVLLRKAKLISTFSEKISASKSDEEKLNAVNAYVKNLIFSDKLCVKNKFQNDEPTIQDRSNLFKEFLVDNPYVITNFVKSDFSNQEHEKLLVSVDEFLTKKMPTSKEYEKKLDISDNLNLDVTSSPISATSAIEKKVSNMTGSEKQEFALLLYDTNARINKEKIEFLEEEIQSLKTGIINLEQYDNLNGKDKQKQANEFLGTILTNAELIKPFLETTDKNHSHTKGTELLEILFGK